MSLDGGGPSDKGPSESLRLLKNGETLLKYVRYIFNWCESKEGGKMTISRQV